MQREMKIDRWVEDTGAAYRELIDKVIEMSRPDFQEANRTSHELASLRTEWLERLPVTKVEHRPASPPAQDAERRLAAQRQQLLMQQQQALHRQGLPPGVMMGQVVPLPPGARPVPGAGGVMNPQLAAAQHQQMLYLQQQQRLQAQSAAFGRPPGKFAGAAAAAGPSAPVPTPKPGAQPQAQVSKTQIDQFLALAKIGGAVQPAGMSPELLVKYAKAGSEIQMKQLLAQQAAAAAAAGGALPQQQQSRPGAPGAVAMTPPAPPAGAFNHMAFVQGVLQKSSALAAAAPASAAPAPAPVAAPTPTADALDDLDFPSIDLMLAPSDLLSSAPASSSAAAAAASSSSSSSDNNDSAPSAKRAKRGDGNIPQFDGSNQDEEEEDAELGSGDDVSEDEVETDNLMLCLFEKVSKAKSKSVFKCQFKKGIIKMKKPDGTVVDLLIGKATGDLVFID